MPASSSALAAANNFRMMAGSEKTIPLVEEETPIQF